MKKLILFLAILLFPTGCILFEDYDMRFYFKQEATGYVYYYKTKQPAPNVMVTVRSGFESYGWATKMPIDEDFYTDDTGFFRIRFLKRTGRQNVLNITVSAYDTTRNLSSKLQSLGINETLDEFILKLDTIWIQD